MGIKDFSKLFRVSATVDLDHFAGQRIAVDAYSEIFRAISVPAAQKVPMLYLRTIYTNTIKMLRHKVIPIWCFDSPVTRASDDPKRRTLAARARTRKYNPLATPTQYAQVIRAVKDMLDAFNISYYVAPRGVDAEHMATYLYRRGAIDGILTTDTDALVYGIPYMLKKSATTRGKYDMYTLKSCCAQYHLKYAQFVKVCIVLGCDYAERRAADATGKKIRVGVKTVIGVVGLRPISPQKLVLDDEQMSAVSIFTSRAPVAVAEHHAAARGGAINKARISKMLMSAGFDARLTGLMSVL
jgi:5'-3' exonuclease